MRWTNCLATHGPSVQRFISKHFCEAHRRTLLIGGAGFDPRTLLYPRLLSKAAGVRLEVLLIKEDRPDPDHLLVDRASANLAILKQEIATLSVEQIEVFSDDLAVTGVRVAASAVASKLRKDFTDLVVDQSALSVGVGFPVIRTVLTHPDISHEVNIHLVVASQPSMDHAVRSKPIDKAREIIGFKGGLGLSTREQAAVLWLPQLAPDNHQVLQILFDSVQPHDVCPILPFPALNPRFCDELLAEYGAELTNQWQVTPGSLIYAAEDNPLDLYRTILRLEDQRRQVFENADGSDGSIVVLSPTGSKVLALGALMASVERDLPMVYIESLGYQVDWAQLPQVTDGSETLTHLWLAGEPYAVVTQH